ncbi:SRPBCC domain-containing protein [Streptomyces sp. 7R007]
MEHEVFVPVSVETLRAALADPARVARAVPGLQQDAGADPVAGRLKVRVGSHSVTYRGAVRVTARDDGSYAAEGEAAESRGTGSVKLALTLRVREAEGGATLAFEGTADADGRVTELPADTVAAAVLRLLNRFAENLAQQTEPPEPLVTQEFEPKATTDFEATPDADDAPMPAGDAQVASVSGADADTGSVPADDADVASPPAADADTASPSSADADDAPMPADDADAASAPGADADGAPAPGADADGAPAPGADADVAPAPGGDGEDVSGTGGDEEVRASVFDVDVPAPSLGPEEDEDAGGVKDFGESPEPPAEAAHARRTMIGRSAEEVDHAPPRGRYAPVPAPQTVAPGSPLRWAAPAAALALASAIVVGRALRRRR